MAAPLDRYDLRNLLTPRGLLAGGVIGAVLLTVTGAFAWTGGFLSSQRLTQDRVVDQFERTNGVHRGFRRNHPKGVCFTGWFDSDGAGRRLSKAVLFKPGRTPVFGRFAIAGGMPFAPDTPGSVHSMATNFSLSDGETWRMGMNGIPVFSVGSVRDLYEQLAAAAPDARTGKPDPAKLKAFFAAHPADAKAMAIIKAHPLPSGFANTTYNSLNAFIFTAADGRSTPVRWGMVAEDAFTPAGPDPAMASDPNYQFTELVARARKGPIRWRMVATLGGPGDTTSDATVPWPADRPQVELGVLTVASLQDETHGACRDVTFDPLILPAGVAGSDDPVLSARSAGYAASLVLRTGEAAPTPAVRLPAPQESAR